MSPESTAVSPNRLTVGLGWDSGDGAVSSTGTSPNRFMGYPREINSGKQNARMCMTVRLLRRLTHHGPFLTSWETSIGPGDEFGAVVEHRPPETGRIWAESPRRPKVVEGGDANTDKACGFFCLYGHGVAGRHDALAEQTT